MPRGRRTSKWWPGKLTRARGGMHDGVLTGLLAGSQEDGASLGIQVVRARAFKDAPGIEDRICWKLVEFVVFQVTCWPEGAAEGSRAPGEFRVPGHVAGTLSYFLPVPTGGAALPPTGDCRRGLVGSRPRSGEVSRARSGSF